MKKLVSILSVLLVASICSAQTFGPNTKRVVVARDTNTLKFSIAPAFDFSAPLFLRTPALQLTFTKVDKVDGQYKLTTPILIGYSYIFSYANGIIHQDSSITVESRFFFGAGANFGITPNPDGTLVTSVPVGAIVGFSRYGAFGGIDVLTGKPLFAVSINLLNVPILQSLTKITVKEY